MNRILFVDDDAHVLQGIARTLRGWRGEWDMSFVTSGSEALAVMEQEPVDVMVTDIRMPVMSGDVLIERVASLYPDTVPLALSGHCSTDRAVAISSRGVRFLAKPCHGTALIAALTEVFVYRQRSIDQACAATSVAVQPDADAHKAMLVLAAAMVRGGLLDAADLPEAFRGNLFAALAGDTVGSLLQEYYEDEARATDDDLRRRLGF